MINPTDETFPATFDEYLARWVNYGFGVEHHLDEIRGMYDRDRIGHRLHPKLDDMPPCPSWCALDYGHRYESMRDADLTAGMLTLERSHTTEQLDDGCVTQDEHLRGGRISYGPVQILFGDQLEEITAGEARKRAAALLNLADRCDGIAS